MTLIYGLVVLWTAAVTPRTLPRAVGVQLLAVVPVVAALGLVRLQQDLRRCRRRCRARSFLERPHSPMLVLGLALGPVLFV